MEEPAEELSEHVQLPGSVAMAGPTKLPPLPAGPTRDPIAVEIDPPAEMSPSAAAPVAATHAVMPDGTPVVIVGAVSTNGLATASLVLALLGVFLPAFVLGWIAVGQIDRAGGTQQGRGMAVAGMVISWLWVSAVAALVIFSHS